MFFSYPWWFVIICVIVAGIYSIALYYKNQKNAQFSLRIIRILGILRFLIVFILCFLLLEPLVVRIIEKVEKPIIVFLHDNTESILMSKDSVFYRTEFVKKIETLEQKLADSYDVASYLFDDKVNDDASYIFNGKETNIDQALKDILLRYSNKNVGAVVLTSDGVFNKGYQPLQTASLFKTPIYTIALGDTTPQKDAYIQHVDFNKIVFLGNEFPIEVSIGAQLLNGEKTIVKIMHNGVVLASQNISYREKDFYTTVSFRLKASQVGLQRYQIVLEKVNEEFTPINNTKDILVEVIDSRQKVLILADGPHPDLAAIKNSIESNEHYQAEIIFLSNFQKSIREFDLVIMYQLPSSNNNANALFQQLKEAQVPAFYIVGAATNIDLLNRYNMGVKINGNKNNSDEVQAVVNPDFGVFQWSDETRKSLAKYPPFLSPYASEIQVAPNTQIAMYKKIGNTATTIPLLFFLENNQVKSGFLLGEGFWKWRLFNYSSEQRFTQADEVVAKIVQYLAVKADKSLFRVTVDQQLYENQEVVLFAELYDESMDFVESQDIKIAITSEEGAKYAYSFSPLGSSYKLNAGKFKPGKYDYNAQANYKGKIHTRKGTFFIKPIQLEATQTQANHQLLYMIASSTNGEMFYPQELDKLEEKINNSKSIVSLLHSNKEITDLIRFKSLFFVILVLLALEWVLRKYNGGY